MRKLLSEAQIEDIWWQALPGRDDLLTDDELPVRIIYPGRSNDDRGADVRDAVIYTAAGVQRGDVEIHVRSSNWKSHRHDRDPAYNRVILHVVYRHDTAGDVRLENGLRVPTLSLDRFFGLRYVRSPGKTGRRRRMNCRAAGRMAHGFTQRVLENAGEARFRKKVTRLRLALRTEEAGQVLYAGIMEALGYSRNKASMRELAGRVPLRRLEGLAGGCEDERTLPVRYRDVLLGAAGLSPVVGPRRRMPADAIFDDIPPMSPDAWQLFKVRPGNYPDRRIAAMAALLYRFREPGILEGLMDVVRREPDESIRNGLEGALVVRDPEDGPEGEGRSTDDEYRGTLLGRERAAEIVVNVVLPFAVAWGELTSSPALYTRAVRLYSDYPSNSPNTLVRHMVRQLRLGWSGAGGARLQQGLLHIYRNFCSQGLCESCPLCSPEKNREKSVTAGRPIRQGWLSSGSR